LQLSPSDRFCTIFIALGGLKVKEDLLKAHPWCEDETHVDTRVLWESSQHRQSVQVAAILDSVALGDGVVGMSNLL
jgi:hypothetical protein